MACGQLKLANISKTRPRERRVLCRFSYDHHPWVMGYRHSPMETRLPGKEGCLGKAIGGRSPSSSRQRTRSVHRRRSPSSHRREQIPRWVDTLCRCQHPAIRRTSSRRRLPSRSRLSCMSGRRFLRRGSSIPGFLQDRSCGAEYFRSRSEPMR